MKRYLSMLLGATLMWGTASADPCGMVPPISLDGDPGETITRVGDQKTYVFYKDGVETIVIHPGFQGDVDEFGMLIPFPEAPALRKVSDDIFTHIEKAVDPPTIDYWVRRPYPRRARMSAGALELTRSAPSAARKDEVKVLKEEAVGMYEVAVLEAGSARALKRWMDDHRFRFPDGMEKTCEDYIAQSWCFVAVKTRVGQKAGVDPRPGMRSTTPDKPDDASFTGKVQAMGFRFRSPMVEVPMRLSAFNEGDLHNVVYLLADRPLTPANLPDDFVVKRLQGQKLYQNLTELLPYKIRGGTEDDMSPNDWTRLNAQRDPVPHNGRAAHLMATDLFVVDHGKLTHASEEKEKALLDIGERLNLRGGRLDGLHSAVLEEEREEIKKESLARLKGMSLTVVDGDFPREVVANENILFVTTEPQARDLFLPIQIALDGLRRILPSGGDHHA